MEKQVKFTSFSTPLITLQEKKLRCVSEVSINDAQHQEYFKLRREPIAREKFVLPEFHDMYLVQKKTSDISA